MRPQLSGIINAAKPSGGTSREVVNVIQRLAYPAKVGHAGTLDPLASGVLLVCVGKATRLIDHLQRHPKTYQATFRLGCHSDTEDANGQVEFLSDSIQPALREVESVLPRFLGEQLQQPPQFSALKVDGKRAYKLARRGTHVALQPRTIMVHKLQLVRFDYPDLELTVECGSGTYVRSLGRDIALALGTQAVMTTLSRTRIGPFDLESAVNISGLDRESFRNHLVPAQHAVPQFPERTLSPPEIDRFACGLSITTPVTPLDTEWTVLDQEHQMLGIARQISPTEFRPSVNFIARS